jgi:hypothetical protein
MKMSQEQIERAINKMISIIKPNDVLSVDIEVHPIGGGIEVKYEYYLDIRYVVPDDSEFLRSSNMRYSDYNKIKWNKEILDNLRNYLGIDTLINSSVIVSESNYQKMKNN